MAIPVFLGIAIFVECEFDITEQQHENAGSFAVDGIAIFYLHFAAICQPFRESGYRSSFSYPGRISTG